MAAAQKVCLANELINAAGAERQVGEVMSLFSVWVVILREGERPSIQFYDPLGDAFFGGLLRLVRGTSPVDHVRRHEPASQD